MTITLSGYSLESTNKYMFSDLNAKQLKKKAEYKKGFFWKHIIMDSGKRSIIQKNGGFRPVSLQLPDYCQNMILGGERQTIIRILTTINNSN